MSNDLDNRFPIVCFGDDWGQYQTSNQLLMLAFARRGHPVVWVNSIGARPPRPTLADLRKIAWKISAACRRPSDVRSNPLVLTPLVLPLPQCAWARRMTVRRLSRRLRSLMKELDMRDPLLWICGPIPAEFIGQLGESAAIYYCADEYSAAPHAPVRVVRALEKHALRSADLTITVSKSLLEAKEEDARRIALLPHGVDAGHFGKALDPETPVPPDIARLPKPVVGYYGLLNERIDWRLLVWLAAQLPAWSFALIGPVAARPIRNLPQNVHLLGPRPYSELPGYLRGFDVAIVPYVPDDTFVRHSSPLKVLELLAAGRPIVTSSIPAVRTQYQGLVGVADTKEAFLAAIQDAASGAGGDITSAGCRLARAMSWDRRAGEALSLLEPVLGVGQSIGAATACTR